MVGQYRVDVIQLEGIDLDWLKHRVAKWYGACEHHLEVILKRIGFFEVDVAYQPGPVAAGGNVTDLLTRELAAAQAAFDQFCLFRKNSWNVRADGVPDIYEHAIQALEHQIFKIERELRLIQGMGVADYIGARMEDG